MTADWRTALAIARRPRTPEQAAWDVHFDRWQSIALRSGRNPNAAAVIAETRTEDQYGQRPANEETT